MKAHVELQTLLVFDHLVSESRTLLVQRKIPAIAAKGKSEERDGRQRS